MPAGMTCKQAEHQVKAAFNRTDFLVSSKKILALSGMPSSCCACVPAPLMPDVALVELPPMKLGQRTVHFQEIRYNGKESGCSPLLVQHEHIRTPLEESVCGRETGETTTDDDDLGHSFDTTGREKGELGENPGRRHRRVLYTRSISGTCDCSRFHAPPGSSAGRPSCRPCGGQSRHAPIPSRGLPGFTFWTRSISALAF